MDRPKRNFENARGTNKAIKIKEVETVIREINEKKVVGTDRIDWGSMKGNRKMARRITIEINKRMKDKTGRSKFRDNE